MIEKSGSAHWEGGLKDGKGRISTETRVLDSQPYGFNTRFQGEKGTNPEELLGAAHAACFSMALSNILGEHGMTADAIDTTATVHLDPAGPAIVKVHLDLTARIANADEEKFKAAAETAKQNCPVSKLFKGAEITMDAKLA